MKIGLDQIKIIIEQHKDLLNKTYHVKNIGVFGSIARSEDTNTSDLDLLVEFSQPVGLFKFIELETYLSKILGKKIDLVTKNALKPIIREEILREVAYV
ncbi:MAG: nucleotidyltransferase family protein [Candidatus Daviesbacteria bacterium]|nr:nucleotidyltransferase family protein [Candidatus Daviesbacteria bacterium]